MHIHVHELISHYGYPGVFTVLMLEMIGIPFPAETTLTVAGIEWKRGVFSLLPLIASATLGNVVGSSIAFGIGKFLGRPTILRLGKYVGISRERLDRAEDKFQKYQIRVTLFSKFIAGIRVLVPYLAGINEMPFVKFTIFNFISALVWSSVFITVGRYIEVAWRRYHNIIHPYLLPGIIGVVILAGVYFLYRKRARTAK
ncbi:DedA family protein [Aneurinibacillus terranovensis]|uniref:DedA family protein n=1 Tax=Aneurinibacillus terranovensis TaxID=278991 RepID=UPI00068776FD|nr:DedA family protein [Aneurinibacillus terranovensis]